MTDEREKPKSVPSSPGPVTLRLRALSSLPPPLVLDERTVTSIRVLGPEQAGPAATADPLWSPVHLGALLNAMFFLFLAGDAASRRAQAAELAASASLRVPGIDGALPLRDGGIDVERLREAAYQTPRTVGFLHAMVRGLFESADAVHEGTHAERAYLAAVEHTLGGGDPLLRDALRVVGKGSRLRARLTVTAGGTEGPFNLAERDHTVGRSSSSDVRLEHSSVSRRHARLAFRFGRHIIADVGSTGGTAVNRERLSGERVLQSGDTIAIGDVTLRFEHLED